MARGPWLMAGLWSVGTAAATTVAWIGAHAVSRSIGATPVPVVAPVPGPLATRTGLAGHTPTASPAATATTSAGSRPAPSTRTATFSDPGGTITVRCSGEQVELLSASPSDGYRGDVGSAGPAQVSVTFLSRDWSYQIDARCSGGRPVQHSIVNQSPSPPPPH